MLKAKRKIHNIRSANQLSRKINRHGRLLVQVKNTTLN